MGIFARLAVLIKSNLNDLISRSEDPEKMLNQVVIDMANQLIEAKKQVAVSIADEKRLAKQAEQEAANAAEWERRAMLAIKAGDDALAKEALNRKKEHEALANTFKDQWQKQKNAVDQLKSALRMLNSKIEEAKCKKNLLVARAKRAEAQKTIAETLDGMGEVPKQLGHDLPQRFFEVVETVAYLVQHGGRELAHLVRKPERGNLLPNLIVQPLGLIG